MSIIGIIIFFIGWVYSIGAFGFFLGVGIGWIPALFVAIILDFIIVFSLGLIGLAIEKRKFSSFQHKFAKNLPEISPSPNPAPAATQIQSLPCTARLGEQVQRCSPSL